MHDCQLLPHSLYLINAGLQYYLTEDQLDELHGIYITKNPHLKHKAGLSHSISVASRNVRSHVSLNLKLQLPKIYPSTRDEEGKLKVT